jgi:hypothetical protein
MAEWLKAHAWKACMLQKGIEGSNPSLSAIFNSLILILILILILLLIPNAIGSSETAARRSASLGRRAVLWVLIGSGPEQHDSGR